jgi:hypothetical protein
LPISCSIAATASIRSACRTAVSHALTAVAVVLRQVFGLAQLPAARSAPLRISMARDRCHFGPFALLAVTTLEKLLLSGEIGAQGRGR